MRSLENSPNKVKFLLTNSVITENSLWVLEAKGCCTGCAWSWVWFLRGFSSVDEERLQEAFSHTHKPVWVGSVVWWMPEWLMGEGSVNRTLHQRPLAIIFLRYAWKAPLMEERQVDVCLFQKFSGREKHFRFQKSRESLKGYITSQCTGAHSPPKVLCILCLGDLSFLCNLNHQTSKPGLTLHYFSQVCPSYPRLTSPSGLFYILYIILKRKWRTCFPDHLAMIKVITSHFRNVGKVKRKQNYLRFHSTKVNHH